MCRRDFSRLVTSSISFDILRTILKIPLNSADNYSNSFEVTNNEPVIMTTQEEISINDMKQDESIKEIIEREKQVFANKFKSSPIISPIYGVEKEEKNEQLELENTANYEKLDAEIKKTNEFLSKLKELQKKLD